MKRVLYTILLVLGFMLVEGVVIYVMWDVLFFFPDAVKVILSLCIAAGTIIGLGFPQAISRIGSSTTLSEINDDFDYMRAMDGDKDALGRMLARRMKRK